MSDVQEFDISSFLVMFNNLQDFWVLQHPNYEALPTSKW